QQTLGNMDWYQGTADAVRQCMRYVQSHNIDHFLILSGDHLYRMDYSRFIEYHRENDADLTIPVIAVEESAASSFGLLKTDATNSVVEFSEKPKGETLKAMAVDTMHLGLAEEEAKRRPYIASMGIYAFKSHVLQKILDENPQQKDFGKEIIPSAIEHLKVQAYLYKGYWEDIGTIRAFYDANMALVKFPTPSFSFYDATAPIYTRQRFLPPCRFMNSDIIESMISEGCIINKAVIRKSLVGIRSFVDEGAEIHESLLMGCDYYETQRKVTETVHSQIPMGIGKNCIIKKAIIDKNARIGRDVKIINKDGLDVDARHEEEGWYIRDGIVIILKDAVIPDGTII
ncbi:MAG: glucose-1-phosphate adenylyltransferase, partial [Calditrichaeota bacterium]